MQLQSFELRKNLVASCRTVLQVTVGLASWPLAGDQLRRRWCNVAATLHRHREVFRLDAFGRVQHFCLVTGWAPRALGMPFLPSRTDALAMCHFDQPASRKRSAAEFGLCRDNIVWHTCSGSTLSIVQCHGHGMQQNCNGMNDRTCCRQM